MLVLSRKKGEVIEIDDGRIMLMVVDVRGDNVRLGIAAPKEVAIHRKEVADKIRDEPRSKYIGEAVVNG